MKKIFSLYNRAARLADKGLSPLLYLAIRVYMASFFFFQGLDKFQSYRDGRWDSVVFAFTEYHPIPGVPGDTAAIMGTGGELVLPVLLALGFLTRISAGGLLIMTLVIQFLVPADYGVANDDHYLWMLLLAVPMLKGGGALSLDFIALKLLGKKTA